MRKQTVSAMDNNTPHHTTQSRQPWFRSVFNLKTGKLAPMTTHKRILCKNTITLSTLQGSNVLPHLSDDVQRGVGAQTEVSAGNVVAYRGGNDHHGNTESWVFVSCFGQFQNTLVRLATRRNSSVSRAVSALNPSLL